MAEPPGQIRSVIGGPLRGSSSSIRGRCCQMLAVTVVSAVAVLAAWVIQASPAGALSAGEISGAVSGAPPLTGATWVGQQVAGTTSLAGVSCMSTSSCIAVGSGPSGSGAIVATGDSGAIWVGQTDPTAGALSDVFCLPSSSDCYAVGSADNVTVGVLLATTDGGANWTSQSAPTGEDGLEGISCVSASTCIAVLGLNDTVDGMNDPIIRTTNGGSTWTSVTAPTGVDDLDGISCSSTVDCVAVAGSHVVTSTDAGATWQTSPGTVQYLDNVSCASSTSDCVAVGGTTTEPAAAYNTTNEGATWTADSVPSGLPLANGVSCATASDCVADGWYPRSPYIMGTTDGGSEWTTESIPSGISSLGGATCPSDSSCFVVGSEGSEGLVLTDGPIPLTITTSSLPLGQIGEPYSAPLTADGGDPPYTWKIESGHLPKGLKLSKSTGTISGTPGKRATTSNFTIEVRDTTKNTATAALSIHIS